MSARWPTLASRYPGSGWVYLDEVSNGTGYAKDKKTYVDALALSLWPSRGIHLHGHEVKSSRSDWLRELKNPSKADEIGRFCHFWWVVALKPDIVKVDDGELPPTWGLLAPKASGRGKGDLAIVRQATMLTPEPWDPYFVAAIMRRFSQQQGETVSKAELERIVQEHRNDVGRLAEDLARERVANAERRIAECQEALTRERDEWHGFLEEVGLGQRDRLAPAAVRLARMFVTMKESWGAVQSPARRAIADLAALGERAREAVEEIEALATAPVPAGAWIDG